MIQNFIRICKILTIKLHIYCLLQAYQVNDRTKHVAASLFISVIPSETELVTFTERSYVVSASEYSAKGASLLKMAVNYGQKVRICNTLLDSLCLKYGWKHGFEQSNESVFPKIPITQLLDPD